MSAKFSNLTDTLSIQSRNTQPQSINDFDTNELALETYINSLQLNVFFELSEGDQNERLAKFDVLELFRAVQNINHGLGMMQLENHVLIDFLQKNDPKLLIGLEKCRAAKHSVQGSALRSLGKSSTMSMTVRGSSFMGLRSRSMISRSFRDSISISSQKKIAYNYKLNFRAKAEMAEKLANEIEKEVQEIERKSLLEIKLLRGHMEEMNILQVETQETATNFELHFLREECDVSDKQLDRNFRKFVSNWIKNARALLATMRLKTTAVQKHCQHLRNELLTKSDLSGILTAVDFEKLQIKRTELLNDLEEKNVHIAGLKGVTGRAALAMIEERDILMDIEEESKQLNNKTIEVAKTITKLEKEAAIVEKENEKDILVLGNLRTQLDHFEAPSINEYIEKKNELLALEKEEKILRRKISILNMQLDNAQRKCKQQIESNIFINVID